MKPARAREFALADPKLSAAVETASSLPLRESKTCDVQVFSLIKDGTQKFNDLFEQHKKNGWVVTVGNKTRGFAVFGRGEEVFALNLDRRTDHVPPNEG